MFKHRVRNVLVDAPGSIGAQARHRRWQMFRGCFPDVEQMRILDLGGTVDAWGRAPVRPAHVTVVNLYEPGPAETAWVTPVTGDACDPPPEVTGGEFDLVFSNSLLEHVGGHAKRQQLATVIDQAASRHWVQTPYRFFPVEPHFLFPGFQFLPVPAQAAVARRWPLVHTAPTSHEISMRVVQWTDLVGMAQMRAYFPVSDILRERFSGLTKSLIAVRRA